MGDLEVLSAIREQAGGEPNLTLKASRGPWFGFNGLRLLAISGEQLLVGRQATPWSKPVVSSVPVAGLEAQPRGAKRVALSGVGRFAFRTAEDAQAFWVAVNQR